jgi:Holliday junction resolvasome RuvABC endonuclease subunit
MKVLALDVSTSTTGFAVVDSNLKLLEYGQFTIKDRTLSDTMYTVEITDKSLSLAEKYKVDAIIIEDIFCVDPKVFRRWARVHGGMAITWYKKAKKEPVFMMAVSARPKTNISGKASKIEVQLEISKRYNLVDKATYSQYSKAFNILVEEKEIKIKTIEKEIKDKKKQTEEKKKISSKFKYAVSKLSSEFENIGAGPSEHISDAIVLGIAFFK